ncbi:50S ribosomal protein L18 [bacterium]|nr:MAG: 50S ribosomal protein L18 [bacterium]
MKLKDKQEKKRRRITRTRKTVVGTPDRPRLAVCKSLRHIYTQVIDDTAGVTIASISSLSPELKDQLRGKTKTEIAELIGQKIGELAKTKGVEKVVFDRHGSIFIGRVKAVAQGARKAGLEF